MIVKESINFERGLDPKQAIDIGIFPRIINYARKKMSEGDSSWSSPTGWMWEIQEDKNLDDKTKESWLLFLVDHKEYLGSKELLDKLFLGFGEDTFRSMSEAQNFERGLDPKKAMNVGLEQQIANFLRERTSDSPAMWISYLLTEGDEEELDHETRKQWIEFLIKKPEYNNWLDENDFYQLKKWGIQWIPYVKLPSDEIQYEFKNGKYFIAFDGWESFSELFDTDTRNLDKGFVEGVLSGENAEEYFEYDSVNFDDITEMIWFLKRLLSKEKIPALDELKEKFIEREGDPEIANNLEELFDEIGSNDAYEDLHDALRFAWADSQEMADQDEAYKDLKNAIKKHFDINDEEIKWVEKPNNYSHYYAPISLEGVEKLFGCLSLNDSDYKIKYYPPQYSYNGDITAEVFNDSLSNRLDEI